MKYELEKLETLITTDIAPPSALLVVDPGSFDKWRDLARREKERIKRTLIKVSFSKKKKQIRFFVHHHQHELIQLSNLVLSYLPSEEKNRLKNFEMERTRENLYKVIYNQLEDLLLFMESRLSKHFNLKEKVPDGHAIAAAKQFSKQLDLLKSKFETKSLDHQLVKVIFHPFQKIISQRRPYHLSFERLNYLKKLITELQILVDSTSKEELYQKTIGQLIYLNFNSHQFFKFCITKYRREYENEENENTRIEKLIWIRKNINQDEVGTGIYYKPKCRSLKLQLLDWIDEEIFYLERNRQLSSTTPTERQPSENDFKLMTSLSVPQLAYLIRLMVDTGIILNKNQRELLKVVSCNTKTKNTGSISANSIRSKFYTIEDSTKEAVKGLVIELLNHIRKN